MTELGLRPMAHRTGRLDRLQRCARQAGPAGAAGAALAAARAIVGRRGGLAVAALLLVGASALPLLAGWGGRAQSALAAMPAGPIPGDVPASTPSLGSLAGATGLDPLDLIGKGVIVAALLYLTLRALRRLQAGPAPGTHRLEVLETRPLGPKASLHLVAVGERRLVVGLTPGGMVSIAELDAAELAAPAGARDGARDSLALTAARNTAAGAAARDGATAEGTALRTLVRDGWASARHVPWSRAMAAIRGARPDAGPGGATR
jgi:flagellar biogenesis protein FliO